MILTNEQLRDRVISDSASYVVDRLFRSPRDSTHGLIPDVRSITKEEPVQNREYLSINPLPENGQVGISGMDIRFGRLVAWTDIVRQNVTKEDMMDLPHKALEPGEKFVLNPDPDGNKVYYMTSFESIRLPSDLEILVDSKSTTGRVGAMSHGVGWTNNGEIITMLQPYSFPLEIICGKTALSQAVIRYRNSPYLDMGKILSGDFVKFSEDEQTLEGNITQRGLAMKFATNLIYRAKKCDVPIDMNAKRTVNPTDYWEMIEGNSRIILDAKTLYLLGSLGTIELGAACGLLSREDQVLTGTGTWGHMAGVFQPFWKGGVTMEVYGFGKREICKGDRAGVVTFDEVKMKSDGVYEGAYQNQKPPTLPKMFRELE